MIPRFLIQEEKIQSNLIALDGDDAKKIKKVLRLKAGDKITLFEEGGFEFQGRIKKVSKIIEVAIGERSLPQRESPLKIILGQALPKFSKMDFIVQKATELGVNAIIPFSSSRSIPKLSKEKFPERVKHWQRIALEAARQSGRTCVPVVKALKRFDEIIAEPEEEDLRLIFWEDEKNLGLKKFFSNHSSPNKIFFLVGPEGGFSKDEILKSREKGFFSVSLGKRILRTETAALALLSIIQYERGDLSSE